MKIDKRLAQEFGMAQHPVTPWWRWPPNGIDLTHAILASAVPLTFTVALLGLGAFIERFVPLAVYIFAGVSLLAASVIAVVFFIMLIANVADIPDD
jgi:hypothetical protein